MEPSEAVVTAAQIAVALAGFAGVVVAFRTESVHQWQPIDKFRLRLLLSNSIMPLALCAVAMLLLTVKPQPQWIWRACSALALFFLIPFGMMTTRSARSLPRSALKTGGLSKPLFYSLGILGTAAILLQIYNLAVLNVFWAFFAAVLFQILAGALQFVRLILIQPEAPPS